MAERDELTDWMRAWQSDDQLAEDTRREVARRVRRSDRWWTISAIVEAVIAVIGLAVTIITGLRAEVLIEQIAMASLSVVVVLTAIGAWRLRRDVGPPAASSTLAWVDFLIARARRLKQSTRSAFIILAVEVVIFIPWIASVAERRAASGDTGAALLRGYLWLGVVATLIAAGFVLVRRHAARDLENLTRLRRDLQ
jgi:hypothetical protein